MIYILIYSSFLNGQSFDIKIHLLSDSSGYYVSGADSSNRANIWKYIFSSPTTSQCQKFSTFSYYAFGQLKLSDTTLFILGTNPASPYQLQLCKHTFGNLSPDWSLKLSWPIGAWYQTLSESLVVSSSIYSFFPYGSTTLYVYMAVMSVTDGSVINRYKSSISCTNVRGSGANGDYIAASIYCSSGFLFLLNRATNVFSIKLFSGDQLYEIKLETATGR